jgi:hypothetical protein
MQLSFEGVGRSDPCPRLCGLLVSPTRPRFGDLIPASFKSCVPDLNDADAVAESGGHRNDTRGHLTAGPPESRVPCHSGPA